jgi:preprotein translocase subunit SecG
VDARRFEPERRTRSSFSMQSVLIVIHILIVIALIAVVLLQRSEGGALGAGGGSGNFMTGRGQANALSRATAILGALFFATSLLMSILAG